MRRAVCGVRREVCGVRRAACGVQNCRIPRTAYRNQQIPDRFGLGLPPHAHRHELHFKVWPDLKQVFHCLRVYFYHLPFSRD